MPKNGLYDGPIVVNPPLTLSDLKVQLDEMNEKLDRLIRLMEG